MTSNQTEILKHTNPRGCIIDSISYTHDKTGNRLSKTEPHGTTTTYTYDAVYRLTQAQPRHLWHKKETYTYDPVGNRTSGPWKKLDYTYNGANQLSQRTWNLPGVLPDLLDLLLPGRRHKGETRYTYDKNGNLIQKQEPGWPPRGITETSYTYDYENRLIKTATKQGRKTETVTYTYDPFGRRITKTVEREDIRGKGRHERKAPRTTRYIYDDQNIILEKDERGRTLARYLHGPGIDEPLALEQKNRVYYYHADGLGSVTALSDRRGNVVQKYHYDSFGNISEQGKIDQPYTYTGREWDDETGLYYYRARYYDPAIGRFITRDPIGFGGGDMNLYGYVGNNAVSFTDPTGLTKSDPWYGYNNKDFQRWFHRCWKEKGGPRVTPEEDIAEAYAEWLSRGAPKNGKCWGKPPKECDDKEQCVKQTKMVAVALAGGYIVYKLVEFYLCPPLVFTTP